MEFFPSYTLTHTHIYIFSTLFCPMLPRHKTKTQKNHFQSVYNYNYVIKDWLPPVIWHNTPQVYFSTQYFHNIFFFFFSKMLGRNSAQKLLFQFNFATLFLLLEFYTNVSLIFKLFPKKYQFKIYCVDNLKNAILVWN